MGPHQRAITVSLAQHDISVFQDGKVIRRIPTFSTGRNKFETPIGEFWISTRRRYAHYTSRQYHAPMPFSLFLDEIKPHGKGFAAMPTGKAFHAGDPHLESHGCIHLKPADAQWLFHWAGGHDVHVNIRGPRLLHDHPKDLRRQR